jgi:hypothetical protein
MDILIRVGVEQNLTLMWSSLLFLHVLIYISSWNKNKTKLAETKYTIKNSLYINKVEPYSFILFFLNKKKANNILFVCFRSFYLFFIFEEKEFFFAFHQLILCHHRSPLLCIFQVCCVLTCDVNSLLSSSYFPSSDRRFLRIYKNCLI